jgi:hypothetical protein
MFMMSHALVPIAGNRSELIGAKVFSLTLYAQEPERALNLTLLELFVLESAVCRLK